jgi:hypothetical protein
MVVKVVYMFIHQMKKSSLFGLDNGIDLLYTVGGKVDTNEPN